MKELLNQIIQCFTQIDTLTAPACEQAFKCRLHSFDSRSHVGANPDLHIRCLDVRIGKTGGIVVAEFDDSVQLDLAREVRSLGLPTDMDIVSPPIFQGEKIDWQRKWSVTHSFSEIDLHFGFTESDGRDHLEYASRHFD